MVRITNMPIPRNIEKVCTITYFVGFVRAPPAVIPSTARFTIAIPYKEQIMHITSRNISARSKKIFIYFLKFFILTTPFGKHFTHFTKNFFAKNILAHYFSLRNGTNGV